MMTDRDGDDYDNHGVDADDADDLFRIFILLMAMRNVHGPAFQLQRGKGFECWG